MIHEGKFHVGGGGVFLPVCENQKEEDLKSWIDMYGEDQFEKFSNIKTPSIKVSTFDCGSDLQMITVDKRNKSGDGKFIIRRSATKGIVFPAFPRGWQTPKSPYAEKREYVYSFCGVITRPKRRQRYIDFAVRSGIRCELQNTFKFGSKNKERFIKSIQTGIVLAPFGVGDYSYRMYEALSIGSPVATHPDQIFPFDEVPVGVYTGPLRKIREWEIPSPEEIHDYYVNNLSPAGWAERFNREVLSKIGEK